MHVPNHRPCVSAGPRPLVDCGDHGTCPKDRKWCKSSLRDVIQSQRCNGNESCQHQLNVPSEDVTKTRGGVVTASDLSLQVSFKQDVCVPACTACCSVHCRVRTCVWGVVWGAPRTSGGGYKCRPTPGQVFRKALPTSVRAQGPLRTNQTPPRGGGGPDKEDGPAGVT